jgi:hypothetical protein
MNKQYTLREFKTLGNLLELKDFGDGILKQINELANRVGAPSYKKTPIFKNKNKKHKKISEEDWNAIRNFKKTELKKNENKFDENIDNLRSLLNKLTAKLYDNVREEIITLINSFQIEDSNEVPVDENLKVIGKMIFEIGSMNKFWSELYGQLYKELIELYPVMKEILIQNFDDFIDVFKKIESCSPEENYDKFCVLNKVNEKRKGLSNFFIVLVEKNVLNIEKMTNLIDELFNALGEYILLENKINEVDEITENLFILISKGYKCLHKTEDWGDITDVIDKYTLLKSKNFKSLSNKTIFKFMDLQEIIEDMSSDEED